MRKLFFSLALSLTFILTSCDKVVDRILLTSGDVLEVKKTHKGKTKIYNGKLCILNGYYKIKTIDKDSGYIVYYHGNYLCGVIDSYGGDIIPVELDYSIRLIHGPDMIYFIVYDQKKGKRGKFGVLDEDGSVLVPLEYEDICNNYDSQRTDTTAYRCVILERYRHSNELSIYSFDSRKIVKTYQHAFFLRSRFIDEEFAPEVISQFYQIVELESTGYGVYDFYHCREVIPPKYRGIDIGSFILVEDSDGDNGAFDYLGGTIVPVRKDQYIIRDPEYVEVIDYRYDYDRKYKVRIPEFSSDRFLERRTGSGSSSGGGYNSYGSTASYYSPNTYNTSISSSSSSSSSSRVQEVHQKEVCYKCHGKGRVKVNISVPVFGDDSKEWCEECKSWYWRSDSHTHIDCDICHGTGYVDNVTYR